MFSLLRKSSFLLGNQLQCCLANMKEEMGTWCFGSQKDLNSSQEEV